jgi:hypothetical protein
MKHHGNLKKDVVIQNGRFCAAMTALLIVGSK